MFGGEITRKLAILALILLIDGTIVITLGATNYMGFGEYVGGAIQNSVATPIRNFIVEKWLVIGTSGWYILATVVGISVVGGLFMIVIIYGLVWQKLIQQKLLGKTVQPAKITSQPAPAPTPLALPENEPPKIEKPQEAE